MEYTTVKSVTYKLNLIKGHHLGTQVEFHKNLLFILVPCLTGMKYYWNEMKNSQCPTNKICIEVLNEMLYSY